MDVYRYRFDYNPILIYYYSGRMIKMIVCMIRHGETDWNKSHLIQGLTDNPLNDTGRRQALKVADYLSAHERNWDLIVSSPLQRAVETGEIIARAIGYNNSIIIKEQFHERIFGSLEGKVLTEQTYNKIFQEKAPGLEKFEDLQKRILSGLIALEKDYKAEKILVCSHAQVIKSVIAYLDPNFDFRFPLKNSSLNYFHIMRGEIKIIKYNVVPK